MARRISFSTVAIAGSILALLAVLASLMYSTALSGYNAALVFQQPDVTVSSSSSRMTGANNGAFDPLAQNPLGIPPGEAINLPSIRVEEEAVDSERKIYGGNGDKKHLGGFTELDLAGISPAVWRKMLTEFGVHSVLDVGCGRGTSTSWFALHGAKVLCVEGSHDAIEKSMLTDVVPDGVVEHDFSRGPWWPADTYDAAWAVEFLEHGT